MSDPPPLQLTAVRLLDRQARQGRLRFVCVNCSPVRDAKGGIKPWPQIKKSIHQCIKGDAPCAAVLLGLIGLMVEGRLIKSRYK